MKLWLTINGQLTEMDCGNCKMWGKQCSDCAMWERLNKQTEIDTNNFIKRIKEQNYAQKES